MQANVGRSAHSPLVHVQVPSVLVLFRFCCHASVLKDNIEFVAAEPILQPLNVGDETSIYIIKYSKSFAASVY